MFPRCSGVVSGEFHPGVELDRVLKIMQIDDGRPVCMRALTRPVNGPFPLLLDQKVWGTSGEGLVNGEVGNICI